MRAKINRSGRASLSLFSRLIGEELTKFAGRRLVDGLGAAVRSVAGAGVGSALTSACEIKVVDTEPNLNVSPEVRTEDSIGSSLRNVPLVEPRSRTVKFPSSKVISACELLTESSAIWSRFSGTRPIVVLSSGSSKVDSLPSGRKIWSFAMALISSEPLSMRQLLWRIPKRSSRHHAVRGWLRGDIEH